MALADALREKLFEAVASSPDTDPVWGDDSGDYHLPISYLGTFITERSGPHKNEMNLQSSAIMHVVNGVRRVAVASRITEPSTMGRLDQLVNVGVISEKDGELFRRSFQDLMMLNIRENLKEIKRGEHPDNYIDPYSLRKKERVALKDALNGVSRLLYIVRGD